MNSSADAPRRRGRWGWIVAILVALLVVYVASPYVALWRFSRELRAADRERLEARVDFRSVRQSLKEQIRAKLPKPVQPAAGERQDLFSGLVERLAPSLVDQLVEAFITPEGLAALITEPETMNSSAASNVRATGRIAPRGDRQLDWQEVNYAFFTGARDFMVDLDGTKLRFRFTKMRWQLKTVELKLDELRL